MTVGMMADRSSVIGLTREYRPDWSFSRTLCKDCDRPQWVRIAKVALHYRYLNRGLASTAMLLTYQKVDIFFRNISIDLKAWGETNDRKHIIKGLKV